MADYESVQQAETAAAGKVSELSEAMIRVLLQQRAEQAKDRNQKQDQPPQPYVPSAGDAALFNSFYQQYRENGVDHRTARDAAADAAIGLGSQDSPAMANAEAQAIAHAQQQAKEYRSVAATAVNPDAPAADRQQANTRRKEIEQDLGINDQPPKVRAQTINGLDPNGKPPRQQLQATYQETLQQHGVSPETAASASQDLANNRGAVDSAPIAQAHQEIHQHNVLKNMYQSVYERHGVSPEIATAAADQLARGNGANRSPEVHRAHNQALANIENPQQVAAAQTSQPVAKESSAGYPTAMDRNHSSAQRIWDKYSSGENGVFESMAKGNPRMQQLSDQLVAKEALLAGEDPKQIQQAISQNSPHAKTLKGPNSYASRTVEKAEQSTEVKQKRAKERAQDASPSRKEAQKHQANQQTRSATKDKPKKKVKSRDQGMSY